MVSKSYETEQKGDKILIFHHHKKEEKLIDLPELPTNLTNPATIANLLQSGATIWCWYKLDDFRIVNRSRYINIAAITNMSYGFDGLTALRKSDHYLVYYNVDIGNAFGIYLKPASISFFKNSNIAELYNNELANSYKLYVDSNSDFFSTCGQYTYNMGDKDFENLIAKQRCIYFNDGDLKLLPQSSKRFINSNALTTKGDIHYGKNNH